MYMKYFMKYFSILHTSLYNLTGWIKLNLVVNHKYTFSRDETHICIIFLKHESTASIIFGAYIYLPPYFSRVINEGSNETAQRCTLIQKVGYYTRAMSFLMWFYLASGATNQYILEVKSERCQTVSIK